MHALLEPGTGCLKNGKLSLTWLVTHLSASPTLLCFDLTLADTSLQHFTNIADGLRSSEPVADFLYAFSALSRCMGVRISMKVSAFLSGIGTPCIQRNIVSSHDLHDHCMLSCSK